MNHNHYTHSAIAAIICLPIFLWSSCGIGTRSEIRNMKISYDTIHIRINSNVLHTYSRLVEYSDGDTEYLYGYNHFLHEINIIDLTNRKVAGSIKLEKEGPDGIQNVGYFAVCDKTIVGYSNPFFFMLNTQGKILLKINKSGLNGFDHIQYNIGRYGVTAANYHDFCYNYSRQELPVAYVDAKTNQYAGIGLIHFDSILFENLPLTIPDFLKTENYGHLQIPNISWKDNSIIYNFPCSSEVYVYDVVTKTLFNKDVPSANIPDKSKPLSSNDNWAATQQVFEHQMTSSQYLSVKYDPCRQLFYRTHLGKAESIKSMRNREMYLMVLDENMNILHEEKLPHGLHTPVFNVMREGIFFQINVDDENLICFLKLNVEFH